MFMLIAGLELGVPAGADHHPRITIVHRGQPVAATYRPTVAVTHRQLGGVAPGGRAATLCRVSTAAVTVERHARRADGLVAVRRLAAAPIEAARPGWCRGRAPAVVAAQLRARVIAAASGDDALRADLDTAHDRGAG